MKNKILHFFPTVSVYSLVSDELQPDIILDRTENVVVGIFREHWVNQLSDAIVRETNDFEIEIWQPDHRAVKIYKHIFQNGVTHVLFPVVPGIHKNIEHDYSNMDVSSFLDRINKCHPDNTIIHLHEYMNPATMEVLKKIPPGYRIFLLEYGGSTFYELSGSGLNLLRRLQFLARVPEERKLLGKATSIGIMNEKTRQTIGKLYTGPTILLTMGVDTGFWKPGNKQEARDQLGIRPSAKVILSASMLRQKKQIDQLIRCFHRVTDRLPETDILLVIAGMGEPGYEMYLHSLAESLTGTGKIQFAGRIDNDLLLSYYHAADLFILVSNGEGSPASVMKAHACGIPVATTPFGQAPEILYQFRCGMILPANPARWDACLIGFLTGKKQVRTMDPAVAEELYGWHRVAWRFIDEYKRILHRPDHI